GLQDEREVDLLDPLAPALEPLVEAGRDVLDVFEAHEPRRLRAPPAARLDDHFAVPAVDAHGAGVREKRERPRAERGRELELVRHCATGSATPGGGRFPGPPTNCSATAS